MWKTIKKLYFKLYHLFKLIGIFLIFIIPIKVNAESYTECEYIETGNATQYFITDYIPNPNSVFEFKIYYKANAGVVFGAYNSSWTTGYGYYHNSSYSNEWVHYFSNTMTSEKGGSNIEKIITVDKGVVYVGGVAKNTYVQKEFIINYPLYILAGNWGGERAEQPINAKLYYFKIYENNVLIKDYVPAKNENLVYGIYDKVNGDFIQNGGTGTLLIGPEVGPITPPTPTPEGDVYQSFLSIFLDRITYLAEGSVENEYLKTMIGIIIGFIVLEIFFKIFHIRRGRKS